MALDRIASSGIRAHAQVVDGVAHNLAQLGVRDPDLVRTRLTAEAPPPNGPGGVRAQTEAVAAREARGPALDPGLDESFVRDEVDIVQELTTVIVARRGFQASLAAERASRAFIEATLKLGA